MAVPTLSNFQSDATTATGNPAISFIGYTPTAGAKKLFAALSIANSGTTAQQTTGMTYDGNAMTLVARDFSVAGSNFSGVEWYQLDNPLDLAASGDVVPAGVPDTSLVASGIAVWTGLNFKDGGPDDVSTTTTESSSTTIEDTVTPTDDDSIVISVVSVTGTPTLVATSPHSEDIQVDPNFAGMAIGHTDVAGSPAATTCEWTMGSSQSREVLLTAAFGPVAADTLVTVSPGVGVVLVLGLAPAVVARIIKSAGPGVGVVLVSGLAPSVTTQLTKLESPGVGTVLVSGLTPSLSIVSGTLVSPGVGTVLVSGLTPTIARRFTAVLDPGVGTVLVSGLTPVVVARIIKSTSPGVGTVLVSGLTPVVVARIIKSTGPGVGTVEFYSSTVVLDRLLTDWASLPGAGGSWTTVTPQSNSWSLVSSQSNSWTRIV